MLTFDIDGLEEMLRRVVREELQAQHTDWLDSKQAATYIGTSVGQIRNLVHEGKLPQHGPKGHAIKLRRGDCDQYISTRGQRG